MTYWQYQWLRVLRAFHRLVMLCGICTYCYRRRSHGEYVCFECCYKLHDDQ